MDGVLGVGAHPKLVEVGGGGDGSTILAEESDDRGFERRDVGGQDAGCCGGEEGRGGDVVFDGYVLACEASLLFCIGGCSGVGDGIEAPRLRVLGPHMLAGC